MNMEVSGTKELPIVSESLLERSFDLGDANAEVTALDIAPHGAFVVAGTSSGMVLLFDLSNPHDQKDGLLIGQIRARGVSKGSSEMLAIDLGRILVNWDSDVCATTRCASENVQQLQLKNLLTFSFSDAKLRGFGAVTRINHSIESPGGFRISARYRLACGRGIKNVHIWHFTAGHLAADDIIPAKDRLLHGKWEYVCDVASNGNTITHIEFRANGAELVSKSAGMCIRLWELNAVQVQAEYSIINADAAAAACSSEVGCETVVAVADAAASTAPVVGASGFSLRPTYVDVANSQDIKCLLPVGSVAYGGTYQFAVLNTGAPKEANREVLELPERYSGDGVQGQAAAGLGRGRRITREIEQVVCSDAGQHALVMCADGGVVFYGATGICSSNSDVPEADADNDTGGGDGGGFRGVLLELPDLFRVKDQQQHPGSWTLRRVGRHGVPVLLRAVSDSATSAVTIEVRLLSGLVPAGTTLRTQIERTLIEPGTVSERSFGYYVDTAFHAEQHEARRAWRRLTATAGGVPRRGAETSWVKSTKKVKKVDTLAAHALVAAEDGPQEALAQLSGRKKKAATPAASLSEKSPTGVADFPASGLMVTPAATLGSSLRHNKISPYEDATARLAGSTRDDTEKVVASPIVLPAAAHASRSASRSRNGNGNGGSAYSSTARLRAWRDEDEDEAADLEDGGLCTAKEARKQQSVQLQTSAVKHFAPLHVGPPPKVRRLQASAAVPQQTSSASSAGADPHQAVGLVRYWLQRHSGSSSSVVVGLGLASLGSCAAQRLGVIAAEQDRLKDQFVRELTTGLTCIKASCDGDGLGTALASVAATYSQIAAEMVGRQQLELQGACAADFIVTQKALQSHSCLDSVKVQFRYAGLLGATAELEAIDKIQEMRV